ncbi:flagellar protein C [Thermoplasmatales archaeon AK]|nr:flagellar protein C [Thermoplasmatales archaeon AK]
MGLLDGLKGLGVKKKETTVNVAQQQSSPQSQQQAQPQQSFDSKFIDGVNQRISNVENEVSKINTGLETAKRNISEMKEELNALKENVKMVVSLYEMVSKKFNPFMDTTPEEIKEITDALREDIKNIESLVSFAISDLRELYGAPDVDSLISDIETTPEDTNDQ